MKRFKFGSVAVLLVLALMLTACAGVPSEGEADSSGSEQSEVSSSSANPSEPDDSLEDGWTRLTEEELKWFNEQFFNVEGNRIVNSFLNCTYTDVKNINLVDLFYDMSEEISDKEMVALKGSEIDFETDFQKLTVAYMDELLRTYANISFEETNKVDLEMFLYLEEFDAYYYCHGDTHYSLIEVKSGAKDENGNLVLQCFYLEGKENCEVTLKAHENGYYFVSNTLAE